MEQTPTFGEILRERRSHLGLTQAELARRAGCAPITIRKMEGNALRPSVQLAELLALALNIPEAEQLGFIRLARQEKAPSPIPRPTPSPAEIGLDDLTGRAVKGFQLAELVGSGGFGIVYRAVQPSVQRDVAVKIILPRYANHPTFIRRFEAEAHLVARLEHPHIVPLYDYWREPNAAYLIMRLLRAGSLDNLLQQGPLPLDIFRRVMVQVGTALAAAHKHNVVHRDIKPANVLLDEAQNAYLGDFGIAKNLEIVANTHLTDQGAIIGSPAYNSPEQIQNEPIRPSSDMYCFALLLFEMLTGRKAFLGPTPLAYLQQHLNEPIPSVLEIMPDLPPAIDDILHQASAKDPEARFSDMNELLARLESALVQSAFEITSTKPGEETAVPLLSTQEITALDNPYRGLRPFTESEAGNFFGRDTLVQELLSLMSDGSDLERFVAVVGPSGSGKSSLVKAGLLPALRHGGLPDSDKWFVVDFAPGAHPWEEVEAALLRVTVNPPGSLLDQLKADDRGLLRAVRRCLPDDAETELLLLIDQFEELFTLVEDEAVRGHFLQSLVTAILDPHSRLRLVLTLRADFTDRPLQYMDFGELMQQRLALVLPLTPDELTQAITRPVEKLGMTMAPELVSTIIQDVGNQPGMLPLLQYALTELFEQRQGRALTLDHYQQTGGVASALARRADEIFDGLDAASQEATRQLFLRLITLGEGVGDTRRRVLLSELEALSIADERDTDYRLLITEYGRYRLFTFDHDPVTHGPTVEVAHEALLREWPRLRGWLRDGREDVRRQRLLAQAAAQWLQHAEDSSYLLRGSRLTSFEAWAETSIVALTPGEHHFLQRSIAERDARHTADEARRQRELETVQRLADEQTKRAEEQVRATLSLRKRAFILAAALVVAAILAMLAAYLAGVANENANLAQLKEREAVEAYSLSLAANARQVLKADNQPLALLLALAANGVENPPKVAWQTLVAIAYAPGVQRRFLHASSLNAVAVSADGRLLLTGSNDGLALLWDVASGEIVQQLKGHRAPVTAVSISPDGRYALSGGADGIVIFWDLASSKVLQQFLGHKGVVSAVAFTPDGQHAVSSEDTAAAPGDLIVWDLWSGAIVRRFGSEAGGNAEGILDMALSSDGRLALVGQFSFADNNDRQTMLWDVVSGEPVFSLSATGRTVNGVAISSDGRFGLAGSADAFIYQWDLGTGELIQRLDGHEGPVLAVAVSANGRQALSASLDQTLIWWDLQTSEPIQRLKSGAGEIHSLHFLDETKAVTVSTDGALEIWDLTSAWQMARWGGNGVGHLPPASGTENRGMALAISPDGRYALSGGNNPDEDLILWEYETGRLLRRMSGGGGNIYDVAFTPDGKLALAAMQDGSLILWDVASGEVLRRLEGHQGSANGVAISSNGERAVSASVGGDVIYWDMQTGEILQRMIGHFEGRGVYDVIFLPGEQHAVSSSWDGTMIVWDLQEGEQVRRLTGLTGDVGSHFATDGDWGIHGISVGPDGRLLSAGRDETLLLWDVQTGKSLRRFTAHAGFVVDVVFTPDGLTAVSTAQNDDLIVWEMATGVPLRRLPLNQRLNSAFRPTLAIHPNGRSLLATDADGSIIKWQMAEPSVAELTAWLTKNRALRELNCVERETYSIEPLCVDGVAQASTAELLTAVGEAVPVETGFQPPVDESETVSFIDTEPAGRLVGTAVLGENRGELTRFHFDRWTYEGKAGEVLQFQMIADTPLTDATLPLAERYNAGVLDTLLFLIAPDGSLLAKASDDPAEDGTVQSDANIEAIVLPEDGVYCIEARSYLDDGAGGYTLRITPRVYEVDPAVLQEYEGHFLEGPWEYDAIQYVENGRLYQEVNQFAGEFELIPIGESEFIVSDGSRLVFLRDENGEVTGYRIWISLVHPIGGQWYDAIKLETEE